MKSPEYLTRVEGIDRIRTAYIMWQELPLALISEEYSSLVREASWVFYPNWDNIDLANSRGADVSFDGVNLDGRKDEYVCSYIPVFISQRVPPAERPDMRETLRAVGLPGFDAFEFMCRTHAVCGNNDLYVSRTPDKIIDVTKYPIPYDIPDWDTSREGWLIK